MIIYFLVYCSRRLMVVSPLPNRLFYSRSSSLDTPPTSSIPPDPNAPALTLQWAVGVTPWVMEWWRTWSWWAMTDYIDPHFIRALCKAPERRNLQVNPLICLQYFHYFIVFSRPIILDFPKEASSAISSSWFDCDKESKNTCAFFT